MKNLLYFLFLAFAPFGFSQELAVTPCDSMLPQTDASFPGGSPELMRFISKNFRYPKIESSEVIYHQFYVGFTIEADGSLTEIRMLRKIPDFPELEKEVIRMIQSMPRWIPADCNRQKIRSVFYLPVTYNQN